MLVRRVPLLARGVDPAPLFRPAVYDDADFDYVQCDYIVEPVTLQLEGQERGWEFCEVAYRPLAGNSRARPVRHFVLRSLIGASTAVDAEAVLRGRAALAFPVTQAESWGEVGPAVLLDALPATKCSLDRGVLRCHLLETCVAAWRDSQPVQGAVVAVGESRELLGPRPCSPARPRSRASPEVTVASKRPRTTAVAALTLPGRPGLGSQLDGLALELWDKPVDNVAKVRTRLPGGAMPRARVWGHPEIFVV